MNTVIMTAVAVLIGIWAYAKISEKKEPGKQNYGPAGYPIDSITGVEQTAGNQPGTVGFVSGSIDNYAGAGDGAVSDPEGGHTITYGVK